MTKKAKKQWIVTLDAEGVLIPEIWIAVAEALDIPELKRTTRDEPDYDILMKFRLALLDEHDIRLSQIQETIAELSPLPGAKEFLDQLRSTTQVLILSDTFEQFGAPLMKQLDWPVILCHQLQIESDKIIDYQIRTPDQKRKAVQSFQEMNYKIVAAGDSYNDTSMLKAADQGFLFRSPDNVRKEFKQFTHFERYKDLGQAIAETIA